MPMLGASWLPGKTIEAEITLNGSAGAEVAAVKMGASRESANSLMVTGLADGRRYTVVWGGMVNFEFGKYTALKGNLLSLDAKDPIGRLVDAGQTYWSPDTFYVDVTTADPFLALENMDGPCVWPTTPTQTSTTSRYFVDGESGT